MLLKDEREQLIEYGKKMIDIGITVGTFGNISMFNRKENLMAITPSGCDYYKTKPEDIVIMTPDGKKVEGDRKPSSEVDMHRIFYLKREDVNAVIHTHSVYATTLACMHMPIEPIHYVIAYSGQDVPCIPYVQFGTWELAEAAFNAMGNDHNACLLGNHGLLSVGNTISFTLDVAQQIEFLAQLYYNTLLVGKGKNLTKEEVDVVRKGIGNYRQK